MPRANRHFLPGYVWHITHRCHRKSFLLKFARDRRSYLHWLFEAKKRFGLSVLDYMVTSNPHPSFGQRPGSQQKSYSGESWSCTLVHATLFRRGRTVSCIPIARRTALKLFSSGFPFGDSVR